MNQILKGWEIKNRNGLAATGTAILLLCSIHCKSERNKAGLVTFDSLKASAVSKVDVETLNTVGLMFLKENNVGDAITIFKKNLASFPERPLVYESYGEAMATTGNWTEALKYYTQALSRDPGNMNAKEILRHIPK